MLEACRNLEPDIVTKSFRCCAFWWDGRSRNYVFQSGQAIGDGERTLQKAMGTRHEDYQIDPFNVAESDIEGNPLNEVDDDSGENEYGDQEQCSFMFLIHLFSNNPLKS